MQNPYNPYEFPPCFADLSFPPEPNDAEEDISEDESSDSTWTSSTSDDDSILSDDSILTFDSAESMTYVLPSSEHKNACYVFRSDTQRFSRPESELSWRMDPDDTFSDYTLLVESEEDGEENKYHVHRNILAHGQRRCDYFAKLFRSPFRENEIAVSHFIFPADVARVFPDFLDILYNHKHSTNISVHNVAALRKLSFYFCSYGLSTDISQLIKFNIQEIGDPQTATHALRDLSFYVKMLCDESEIGDTIELRAYIAQRIVLHLTHFGSFFDESKLDSFGRPKSKYEIEFRKENRAYLSATITNMCPDLLVSVLMKATSSLTNRVRLLKSNSTNPLSDEVLRYLTTNASVTSWHFERIVLCLLDFLPPTFAYASSLGHQLLTCANRLSMANAFVLAALKMYHRSHKEAWSEFGRDLEYIVTDDEIGSYTLIIEGDLSPHTWVSPHTEGIPMELPFSMKVADLKFVIYTQHAPLLPMLQNISTSRCTTTAYAEDIEDCVALQEVTWERTPGGRRKIFLRSLPMALPITKRRNS